MDESRIQEIKSLPLAMEGLSPAEFMDMIEIAVSDARDAISEKFPEAEPLLSAYECLMCFYLLQGEKNLRDTREALDAACVAWDTPIFGKGKQALKDEPVISEMEMTPA